MREKSINILALLLSVFLVYTAGFGQVSLQFQRGLPMVLAFSMILLLRPLLLPGRLKIVGQVLDIVIGGAMWLSWGYVLFRYEAIALSTGWYEPLDVAMCAVAVLTMLEVARRTVPRIILIVALAFIGYTLYGNLLPGILGHAGIGVPRFLVYLCISQDGILGVSMGSMTRLIFMFLVFGAFMQLTGAGDFIVDLARALTHRITGGPALAAVVASSFFGTLSGSAVANVVGTGAFTIPLMKKAGFKPEMAGAVEAVASTGGQLVPPIMGSAAFLMSELLGIPYIKLCLHALFPAILYYVNLFLSVFLTAKKDNLGTIPVHGRSVLQILREGRHVVAALIVLVAMMIYGYSPQKAAFVTTILLIGMAAVRLRTDFSLRLLLEGLEKAARQSLVLFGSIACIGIVVAAISATGLGVKFAMILTSIAGRSIWLLMLLVMVGTVVMGMGMPPLPAYLLMVAIVGGSLEQLGLPRLVAHMFVFYFGALAPITPPVALASFTAAGIADADPVRTGWQASVLALPGFIIPFLFVAYPELLMIGSLKHVIWAVVPILVAIVAISQAVVGQSFMRLCLFERVVLFAAAFSCLHRSPLTDAVGVCIVLVVVIQQYLRLQKKNRIVIKEVS